MLGFAAISEVAICELPVSAAPGIISAAACRFRNPEMVGPLFSSPILIGPEFEDPQMNGPLFSSPTLS